MKSDNKIVVDEIVALAKHTGHYRRGAVYMERGWWHIDCMKPELLVRARVDEYGPEPRYDVGYVDAIVKLSLCDAMMRSLGYTPSAEWDAMIDRVEGKR